MVVVFFVLFLRSFLTYIASPKVKAISDCVQGEMPNFQIFLSVFMCVCNARFTLHVVLSAMQRVPFTLAKIHYSCHSLGKSLFATSLKSLVTHTHQCPHKIDSKTTWGGQKDNKQMFQHLKPQKFCNFGPQLEIG